MVLENKKIEENEIKERSHGQNITNIDWLRFCEAMMSDDMKSFFRFPHNLLSITELNSRNSVMRVIDFYDKVSEVFNNANFTPLTRKLPNLHKRYKDSIELPIGEYCISRPKLANMVHKYKLSGSEMGQRDEEYSDYRTMDHAQCVEGNDMVNFMEAGVNYWHKLESEGFVQFTFCILDEFQRSIATYF